MHRDLIVIGASAGGVEALRFLIARLPADLDAAVVVVVHVPAASASVLPMILGRAGPLPTLHPKHGAMLTYGTVFVAPPDHHVLIHGDRVRVTRGPRVNGHRPAIDPLFRSAARWAGARVIGVVLSGMLDDGTLGLGSIHQAGGVAFVQDPSEAAYPAMPANAIAHVPAARVLRLEMLAEAIVASTRGTIADEPRPEVMMTPDEEPFEFLPTGEPVEGAPSGFTCPECNGALWAVENGELVRYQCHVGHSFTERTLLAGQSAQLEDALWAAFRALKENAALSKRLADRARTQGFKDAAAAYERTFEDASGRATLIERILERGELAASMPDSGRGG